MSANGCLGNKYLLLARFWDEFLWVLVIKVGWPWDVAVFPFVMKREMIQVFLFGSNVGRFFQDICSLRPLSSMKWRFCVVVPKIIEWCVINNLPDQARKDIGYLLRST